MRVLQPRYSHSGVNKKANRSEIRSQEPYTIRPDPNESTDPSVNKYTGITNVQSESSGFKTEPNSHAEPAITFKKGKWKLMTDPELFV